MVADGLLSLLWLRTTFFEKEEMTMSSPILMTFDVSPVLPGTAEGHITAWVYPPELESGREAPLWLFCLPGGTYRGRAYYDRQVPGIASETFSLVRFLARQGIGSIVIDTFGTGASSRSLPGEQITHALTAEINSEVLQMITYRLEEGSFLPSLAPTTQVRLAGMGHGLGASQLLSLALLQQERERPLLTTIFVGWSHEGWHVPAYVRTLSSYLPAQQGYLTLPRATLREMLYCLGQVPASLIEIDEVEATCIPTGLLERFEPEMVRELTAQLRMPILHVLAEHDVSRRPHEELRAYTASPLTALYLQPDAAHGNLELSRTQYWTMLAHWLHLIVTLEYGT